VFYFPIIIESVLLATAFSCIEAGYRRLISGKLKTTFAQWWVNILTIPLFIFAYQALIPYTLLRVSLMPLNIWTMELVQAKILKTAYGGVNPAWDYSGEPGSRFSGVIDLRMGPEWLLLGLALELKSLIV